MLIFLTSFYFDCGVVSLSFFLEKNETKKIVTILESLRL